MAKAFALIRMDDSGSGSSIIPDLPYAQMTGEVFNYVLCDRLAGTNWGAYLCSARGDVLSQLDQLWDGFIGIVAVTAPGGVVWGELENPCSDTVRDRLNTWLEARNLPTIPESWTNRRVVQTIFRRANDRFDFAQIDIREWDA